MQSWQKAKQQKLNSMKKNIIIGILSLTSILSITFAIYQRTVAEKMKFEAEHQYEMAKEYQKEAEQQRAIAEMRAAEAMRQHQIAMEQSALATKAMKAKH